MDFSGVRRSIGKRGTVQLIRNDMTVRQRQNNDLLQQLIERSSGDMTFLNIPGDETHTQYICGVTPMDETVIVGTAP